MKRENREAQEKAHEEYLRSPEGMAETARNMAEAERKR